MSKRILIGVAVVIAVALWLVAPIYLEGFWLNLGFAACGAAVGALGLNVLSGTAGQISLAHAFFLAVGALTYVVLSGDPHPTSGPSGLGWPTLLALVASIVVTAVVGFVVSPISSRLSGLYLAVGSLALVYIGQHLFVNLKGITGGHNGRGVPSLSIFGFSFSREGNLVVGGVPFGADEKLWYLGPVVLAICAWSVHRLLRSRHGRAMRLVRDKQLAASVSGVDVRRVKQNAFVVSSALAGLSGALFALAIGSVAPIEFTLGLSIQYLVMIVIGGLDSIAGSILGAFFVTAAQLLIQHFASDLPFLGEGVSPLQAADYLYGAALIAILMVRPRGLVALFSRTRRPSLVTEAPNTPRNRPQPTPAGQP